MAFSILGSTFLLKSLDLETDSSMKTGGPLKILLTTIENGILLCMNSSTITFSRTCAE